MEVNSEKLIAKAPYLLMLALLLAGSAYAMAAPRVMPQAQAAHFCRLFINDGGGIMPLNVHVLWVVEPRDSLTREQIFVEYLLRDNNWQSLRFFPHCQDNGSVAWYAPAEALPASLGIEHQKYIREVFPRLIAEVEAGNWMTVDAYIDRMIEYQCQFGGSKLSSSTSSNTIIVVLILLLGGAIMRCLSLLYKN